MSRKKKSTAEQVEAFLLETMLCPDEKTENRLEAAKQLRALESDKKKKPSLNDWSIEGF